MIQPGGDEHRAAIRLSARQDSVPRAATLEIEHQVRSPCPADPLVQRPAGGIEYRIDPRTRRVDHQPARSCRAPPRQHVVEIHAARPPPVNDDVVDRRVVTEIRPGSASFGQVLKRQTLRRPHLGVVVEVGSAHPVGRYRRLEALEFAPRERGVPWRHLARREQVVERQTGADVPRRPRVSLVHRQDEPHRPDEVRAFAQQLLARLQRLVHQPRIAGLEVSQSPVNQLR